MKITQIINDALFRRIKYSEVIYNHVFTVHHDLQFYVKDIIYIPIERSIEKSLLLGIDKQVDKDIEKLKS
jgi:hypothetical protein